MQVIITFLKSFSSFSKKELNGVFLLISLIIIVLASPWFFKRLAKVQSYDFENFKMEAKSFKNASKLNLVNDVKLNIAKIRYFNFDPNSISDSEWAQLGLSDKQIKVLRNYVNKGGKFLKNDDLKRIYSITESQYQLLEPYIRIPERELKSKYPEKKHVIKPNNLSVKAQLPIIELNAADSLQLLKIRGIGPAFASRIIRFRNRLGGFYKLEQLQEVYGIDSLKFSQIKDQIRVDADLIQKINVNTATFEQFKKQPYLSYKQINALIQYRRQHGNFKTIDDLKKIVVLNEEIIRKIEPYFTF